VPTSAGASSKVVNHRRILHHRVADRERLHQVSERDGVFAMMLNLGL
jgi:hypothetical protein